MATWEMLSSALLVLSLLSSRLGAYSEEMSPRSKFKAAVYSHSVIVPPNSKEIVSRSEALANMEKNMEIYREQASEAKRQVADILVFPEDGLYGYIFTRDSIYPYLEFIPDPLIITWSPCDDPDRYANTEVQMALSCLAKKNSMYIVANMGDKQPCNRTLDQHCPPDGRYQFNTDVAFGPDGTLLAKYHKFHLFYEDQFDIPTPEISFFDTPFGRFGLMVCFDVLFKIPGIDMVLKSNISNIAFPTAWMDALPLLSALGFHSSFSRALGINFLSANIHHPDFRFHGSGIYTPDGVKAFYYGPPNSPSPPKLIVAELDVLLKPRPNINVAGGFGGHISSPSHSQAVPDFDQGGKQSSGSSNHISGENKDPFGTNMIAGGDVFYSYLFHDKFTFRTLDQPSGKLRVCQKKICCNLQYTMEEDDHGKELFAFGAFDGLHVVEGQSYFQICAMVKCSKASDRFSCGSPTSTTSTSFKSIVMRAELETPFIYPQMILSDTLGNLALPPAESWTFKNATMWTSSSFNHTVLSAALFGRDYGRDDELVIGAQRGLFVLHESTETGRMTRTTQGNGSVILVVVVFVVVIVFFVAVFMHCLTPIYVLAPLTVGVLLLVVVSM